MREHDARGVTLQARSAGSRRRRVWELATHAHCSVVGVCLPRRTLRRLADKVLGDAVIADDYELHCGVIADCQQRTPMAQAVQRELDRRYAMALRSSARIKDTDALAQWWREMQAGSDVAGALWATLTHPRCDAMLAEQVLRDIHMLQHQVGSTDRDCVKRLHELADENAVLTKELAVAQRRATQVIAEQGRKIEQLQAQAMQLRAQLIGRETSIATLTDELRALEDAVPGLKSRVELGREVERQASRSQDLERALLRAQHDAERAVRRAEAAERALAEQGSNVPEHEPQPAELPRLDDRSVLCVGGRQASVPVYRKLIERIGARFLHHDGGAEDAASQLDATLDKADLVICQTGCISHDAYWRVKDHCKRTGKQCVFVESPSRAGLERALVAARGAIDLHQEDNA